MTTNIKIEGLAKFDIVFLHNHYAVYQVVDGKRNKKSDFTNGSLEQVISYLAKSHRRSCDEIMGLYIKGGGSE